MTKLLYVEQGTFMIFRLLLERIWHTAKDVNIRLVLEI